MADCKQIRVAYLLWSLTILVTRVCAGLCYVLLYRTKVLAFNCGWSVAKYRQWKI